MAVFFWATSVKNEWALNSFFSSLSLEILLLCKDEETQIYETHASQIADQVRSLKESVKELDEFSILLDGIVRDKMRAT